MNLLGRLFERKEVVDSGIKTKGDVARAAARLGQKAVKRGLPPSTAAELAAHELSHGLEDESRRGNPAEMSLGLNPRGGVVSAEYKFDQSDPKNVKRVATAPSRLGMSSIPMSEDDVEDDVKVYKDAVAREEI